MPDVLSDLSIYDLRNEIFYTFEGQAQNIKGILYELFDQPPRTQVVNRIESAFACVEAGMGVTIGNSWSSVIENDSIISLPIDQKQNIILAIKKEHKNEEAWVLLNELLTFKRFIELSHE